MTQQQTTSYIIVFIAILTMPAFLYSQQGGRFPVKGEIQYIIKPELHRHIESIAKRRSFADVNELIELVEYTRTPNFRRGHETSLDFIPALKAAVDTFGSDEIPLVLIAGVKTENKTLRIRYAYLLNQLTKEKPRDYIQSVFGDNLGPKLEDFCILAEQIPDVDFSDIVGDGDAEAKRMLDDFAERVREPKKEEGQESDEP